MSTTAQPTPGRLLLVPAPLDFGCEPQGPLEQTLPAATLQAAATLRHWVCENAKTARALLKRLSATHPLPCTLQEMHIQELPRQVHKKGDHQGQFDARPLLQAALQGHDIGLVSEAGMPAVADPGSSVVRAAHDLGLTVVPLVGPASLLLALAGSGLNGQDFAFVGYIPTDAAERSKRLRELEQRAQQSGQSQLFIETPYRNAALLQAMLQSLKPTTRIACASGLTLPQQSIRSATVQQWKQRGWQLDNDTPVVFALGV